VRATFTICIKDKKKLFYRGLYNAQPEGCGYQIVSLFNEILKEILAKQKIKNWVYVYMPDHLHLILEGSDEKSNLLKAIYFFKQKTGFWLSKNMRQFCWQKDFYDHIHRKDEDLKKQIRYILDNPVRAGLVDHIHRKDEDLKKQIRYILDNPVRAGLVKNWEEYPFKGSFDYDLEDIL